MTFQKTIDPSLRLIVEEWKRTNLKREKQSDLNPEIFPLFQCFQSTKQVERNHLLRSMKRASHWDVTMRP